LGYTKSEDVGLIVHAISFQDFQPMWSWSTNVPDRQTTCYLKTALCTIVHRLIIRQLYRATSRATTRWRHVPKQAPCPRREKCAREVLRGKVVHCGRMCGRPQKPAVAERWTSLTRGSMQLAARWMHARLFMAEYSIVRSVLHKTAKDVQLSKQDNRRQRISTRGAAFWRT